MRPNLPSLKAIALGLVVLSLATGSFAQQLVITYAGTGSGTMKTPDANRTTLFTFTNASFTLTATTVDVAGRQELYTNDSVRYGYSLQNSLVSIAIAGVGNYTVTWPGTQVLVGNTGSGVAFTRAQNGAYADLLDGPTDAAFSTWDMLTAIGPISGTATLLQWPQAPDIYTDQGILVFNDASTPITFSAQIAVPEPSTYAALAGIGVLGFAAYRRRRGQAA